MPSYNRKDAVALAYDANKKRIRLEGRLVLDEVLDAAIDEMTTQFNAALARGEVQTIGGTRGELQRLVLGAATRTLEAGDADAA